MDTQHEEIWNAHRQMVKAHNSTARILAEENRELAQRVEDLEATVRRMQNCKPRPSHRRHRFDRPRGARTPRGHLHQAKDNTNEHRLQRIPISRLDRSVHLERSEGLQDLHGNEPGSPRAGGNIHQARRDRAMD